MHYIIYNIMSNIIKIFITSSLISLITLSYLNLAFIKNNYPQNINYKLFPIIIPLLYGIFGVINHHIISKYGNNSSIFVGILFGLLLSIIGRFGLNLPIKLFNFNKSTQYRVHIYAIIIYSIIF